MAPSVLSIALYALLASSSALAQDVSDVETVDRHMPKGFSEMYGAFGPKGQPQRGTQGPSGWEGKFGGGQGYGGGGHGYEGGGKGPSAEGGARGYGGGRSKGHGGHGFGGHGGMPGAEGGYGRSKTTSFPTKQRAIADSKQDLQSHHQECRLVSLQAQIHQEHHQNQQ
jgi:hypothetical protein